MEPINKALLLDMYRVAICIRDRADTEHLLDQCLKDFKDIDPTQMVVHFNQLLNNESIHDSEIKSKDDPLSKDYLVLKGIFEQHQVPYDPTNLERILVDYDWNQRMITPKIVMATVVGISVAILSCYGAGLLLPFIPGILVKLAMITGVAVPAVGTYKMLSSIFDDKLAASNYVEPDHKELGGPV